MAVARKRAVPVSVMMPCTASSVATTSGASGFTDKSPVVMRIKNERRDPNGTIAYTFPAELTDAIFDLAPCVPETVRVEYDAYDAPNAFVEPPSYTISLDTNCATGSFAAMATWANSLTAGSGMFVNVSDDRR